MVAYSRGVGTTGVLAPAMLKPRGESIFSPPQYFPTFFPCCSLNIHSLSLCCLHTIKTENFNKQKTHRPILPIRLANVINKMANFYVCCEKQQSTRSQLMHRPTLKNVLPCNVKIVPTPLANRRVYDSRPVQADCQEAASAPEP